MKSILWLFLILLSVSILSCGKKKKASLSGDAPVEIGDFIESFPAVNLPFVIADTSINKKARDSMYISYSVFTQFVPDTVLKNVFGKSTSNVKIYPLGSTTDKETYLFAKAIAGEKKAAFVVSFEDEKYVGGMPLLIPDATPATRQFSTLDKKFTISKIVTRKNADGSTSEGKDVFVLNTPAKSFMLIMTDALDEKHPELINPIDTFQKKNKFSGDYLRTTKNLVSIRDNKKAGRFTFFIHFENAKKDCSGELKGEAAIISANSALYRAPGDPCVLQFYFTSSSVTIVEKEGCGSHRGVNCLFEGAFTKKKEPKKPKRPAKK